MRLYEGIASALVAESNGPLFGVMGDGNISLWGALGYAEGVRIIPARHEAAAVAMADGYFRATGKVGIATVTCGPGLTQVGTSLVVAARNRSSLVLIAGEIPPTQVNKLQSIDQRRLAEAFGTRFQTVSSPSAAPKEVAQAFYTARVDRCPVLLNLPIDIQEQPISGAWNYIQSAVGALSQVGAANEDALERLAELLIGAERPVIIAGAGAIASNARSHIVSLANRIGALLATSLLAKGLFDGEEFNAGIAGGFVCAPSELLFQDADVVLGIGAELGFYTLDGGRLFPNATVARIDIDPALPAGKNPELHVQGDASETVAALNRVLVDREIQREGFRTSSTRAILNSVPPGYETPNDGLDPRLLARSLAAALPVDSIVTCGVGHFWGFVAMYTTCPPHGKFYFSHQFGAIGQTLPLAIGIGVGIPDHPHIVVEGDGSVMMHLQEFDTVVRYRLPMILIVWNDSGFGAEVHKLRLRGFDATLAQWSSPDFVAIAKSFGGDGIRLESENQIGDAIARGLKARTLFVIDARVSPSIVSDLYLKTHFGSENRAPLLQGSRSSDQID